ncbi:hypothetical protein FGO68_gene1944 [Halteria grandinella]|uniref:Ribonuclease n=1 Tax=Halteria grandinella TaxID=5974 RepID=A0A8J8T0E3_HALGN|nr:hypothetical protein FGO68_gene1944 [Halteria grandinella]
MSTKSKCLYAFKDLECEVGIDEAGRGPVLGPMVYGCCFWPLSVRDEMKKTYGFTDSKQLSEADRDRLFADINSINHSQLGYFVSILHSEYLSNTMLAEFDNGGKNLNKISHDTAIELINRVKDAGIIVRKVILDTVGQPEKYVGILRAALKDPSIEIVVESKADFNHPVVSAASICAKVTRDQVLRDWQYPEKKQIDSEFGCGYPGDPKAKQWLKRNFDPVFGFPTLVRFSWKTCSTILEDNKANVEWFDPVVQPQNFGASDGKKQKTLGFGKTVTQKDADDLQKVSQKERENNRGLKNMKVKRNFQI